MTPTSFPSTAARDCSVSACAYDDKAVKQCLSHQQQGEAFGVHVMSAGLRQTSAVSARHQLAKGRQVWHQSSHGFPAAAAHLPRLL